MKDIKPRVRKYLVHLIIFTFLSFLSEIQKPPAD